LATNELFFRILGVQNPEEISQQKIVNFLT